jgi:hypothetical protein
MSEQMFHEEQITFDGKEYRITAPTIKTRGLFTSYLEESAVRFVRRNKENWGTDYAQAMDRVTRKGAAHAFSWGSETFNEALQNDEGFQELAYLILRQAHPDISRKVVVDGLWDAPGGKIIDHDTHEEKDGTLGAELVQKILKVLTRPNSVSPVEAPGSPSQTPKSVAA